MTQHVQLAQGRWQTLPFVEQMANIGSEVERSLRWRSKGQRYFLEKSLGRALELELVRS